MQEFLTFVGHGFCHQIPERSFEADGLFFAVCARDTGIHLGLAFALLWAFALYGRARIKPGDLPPAPMVVLLVLLVVPLAADGVSSYIGWRETDNTIRFVTGLLCGVAVGSLLAPFLMGLRRDANTALKAYAHPQRPSLPMWVSLTGVPATAMLTAQPPTQNLSTPGVFMPGGVFFPKRPPARTAWSLALRQLLVPILVGLGFMLWYPQMGLTAPLFTALCFIAAVTSVNVLILSLITRLRPSGKARRWVLVLCLGLVLATIEISLAALLRDLVLSALLGSPVL